MSYLRNMFVLIACCLSSILGDDKDFLVPSNNKDISKEAFSSSEKDDNLNRRARQSFSFSSFQPFTPNALPTQATETGSTIGVSFQRIRMGPEDSVTAQQVQPSSGQSSQLQPSLPQSSPSVIRPRLTLNDLNFNGFNFKQASSVNTIQPQTSNINRFQNFQRFQTVTEPSRLRNVQPTLASSQIIGSQFPSFQENKRITESPRSRFISSNLPPNRDPRRRNRNQLFEADGSQTSRTARPNSIQESDSEREKFSNRRMRQRLRVVTRAPVTRQPVAQFIPSTNVINNLPIQQQNQIQESVRSFIPTKNFDYEDEKEKENDLLIQNCLKEAEKHAKEIEELENRTALHIDYAQEKQLEIQNLEITLETVKNTSKINVETIESMKKIVTNLTEIIDTKDAAIFSLKDDITKLEDTFENEELKKHETIQELNSKLENTTIELAKTKILLEEITKENYDKTEELKDALAKIEKMKKEKKNLLRIVQQLAEIGNPSLNFNTFSIGSEEEDYEDYEEAVEGSNVEEEDNVEIQTSEPEGSGDTQDS